MIIPPKYILTPTISQLLASIEGAKEVINSIQIPPEIEQNIRRQSSLKSSLFSARIEGNQLTLEDLSRGGSKDQRKIEVFNILKAQEFINQRTSRDLTMRDILQFHSFVMTGLVEKNKLGIFRVQANAIFNSAGIAIYLPPRPSQIKSLINKLLVFANSSKEPFTPIKAMLVHFSFEKIHPFLDGNGRVGRLLIQAILAKGGYGMKGLLNIEERLDKARANYYRGLEDSERDVTGYLEFMLEAFADAAIEAEELVLQKEKAEVEDYLLPRRAELLRIIEDQRLVNFDQIRRRFLRVNERTLRFDLKKPQDAGLIRKRGTTKGVYYERI